MSADNQEDEEVHRDEEDDGALRDEHRVDVSAHPEFEAEPDVAPDRDGERTMEDPLEEGVVPDVGYAQAPAASPTAHLASPFAGMRNCNVVVDLFKPSACL